MRQPLLIGIFLGCVFCFLDAHARHPVFAELERVLGRRAVFTRQKEARIDSLKRQFHPDMDLRDRFRWCQSIYEEYHTYRFDSAMHYVNQETELAEALNDTDLQNLCRIHRSVLLATAGYFSESVQNLQAISSATLLPERRADYYTAYEWAYSMWAEYSDDQVYAPTYYRQEMLYQDSLIQLLPPTSALHHYWKGERLYRLRHYEKAQDCYRQVLDGLPVNVRLYAMASFGMALCAAGLNDKESYERYLAEAAISDQVCPLKEHLALQQLAFHIFQRGKEEDVERANQYLKYAMEDAIFYNNRLRTLEAAQKFPAVVHTFQTLNEEKNFRLKVALASISILVLGLLVAFWYIYRQMWLLHRRRDELATANQQLQEMNLRLQEANGLLVATNHTREEYVSLFMDLCAAYINKLHAYQATVKRKVLAKQVDDLLKMVQSTKQAELDAKEFFVNFDTAFLTLYPHFIRDFNALLREGEEIVPKKGELLTTELRIFALVRMGVRDSSKIATLLFYSPQTIYNYRSAVKNRARQKEDFEKQVEELCTM